MLYLALLLQFVFPLLLKTIQAFAIAWGYTIHCFYVAYLDVSNLNFPPKIQESNLPM